METNFIIQPEQRYLFKNKIKYKNIITYRLIINHKGNQIRTQILIDNL